MYFSMDLLDKGDSWGWLGADDNVYYDDGTATKLTTNLVRVPFGKYKGWVLSELDDIGYLQWLKDNAVEKRDLFQEKMCIMRLYELQE